MDGGSGSAIDRAIDSLLGEKALREHIFLSQIDKIC